MKKLLLLILLFLPLSACKEESGGSDFEYDIVEGQKYVYSENWQRNNMFRGIDKVYIVYRNQYKEFIDKTPKILRDETILPLLRSVYTKRYQVEKPGRSAIRHPESFDLKNQPIILFNLSEKGNEKIFETEIFPNPNNLYVFLEKRTAFYDERKHPGLNFKDITTISVIVSRGTKFIYDSIDRHNFFAVPHDEINDHTLEMIKIQFEKTTD